MLQDARHIAQYYIFSKLEDLNVDFKSEKMLLCDFSDNASYCMKVGWKEQLREKFFAQSVCQGKNEPDLHRRVSATNFDNTSDYEVCRGHDLLDTCYNTILHGSFIPDEIMKEMIKAYTSEFFANTNLYKDLNKWADSVNVQLMV